MSGRLPPGCTQRMCDEAQPGYWDEHPTEAELLADYIDRLYQSGSIVDWGRIVQLELRLQRLEGK